jgi:excisionase family DNA binding protein
MEKEILTMEEASELFGVSVKTFIKLLKEEKVPARKIGREWRFSRKALIEWLSAGDSQFYSASEGEAREFFNQVAPEWEKISSSYYDESIKSKLVSMGLLKPDMTVVDVGAGDGYLSRCIAGYVRKVIAVDISGKMLKELEKKAAESGIANIFPLEADVLDVPLEDSSADLVCGSMYLHHIEEPELALREISRIIKPGGNVFIADFAKHSNVELKNRMHDLWAGFRNDEIKEWFKKCGFGRISIETLNHESSKSDMTKILIVTAVKTEHAN